ncbi:MAG: outer membrane protein transport protein [Moraxellaceae bacterium]|nr:outer membrane protein transport protein [Moraxellaceae bacterium]
MNQNNKSHGLIAIALATASFSAHAAMGSVASTYGLLPADIASAQALSLFNPDTSATYYNPASLASDPRGELTGGLLHAEPHVTADSQGGSMPLVRTGDELPIGYSQQTLLGLKTNLSSLTKVEHPVYLGVMLGVEKYGKQMLAFNSETSTSGQYFSYGRQPLFLTVGGATTLVPGIDAGLSARVTLHSSATLSTQSDLAGNTSYESLDVSAKPVLKPIAGINIDWGRLLCADSDCALKNWHTAAAYRAYSNTRTQVNANAVIPGTIPPPGLTLAISTLDAYQPNIYTLGMQYKGERLRAGLTGEWQQWSKLADEFSSDTIRDQANLRFRDVLIPRLGAEYRLNDRYVLTGGLAWEASALKSDRSLDVNYLDNDRLVVGLGASAEFRDPWIFAFPVRLDFGYQAHLLKDREFELTSSQVNGGAPYETLKTGGTVHAVAGSLTLKF